jgi:lipoprotein-anchoring transpeptidase ErfK/SrfK
VAPPVTTASLRKKFGTFLAVNRGEFRLRLFKDFRLVKTYTVSIGQIGYETAAGLYRIGTKAINPNWIVPREPWAGSLAGRVIAGGSPENPLKARWMGFHDGAGIHGTDAVWSLGHAASHGCIRMSIPDVEELYERVPLGTPIYIG